jgi:hypothetical protein
MPTPLIQLAPCTPIAGGNNRHVYAHPADPALLIKIVKPDAYARRSGPEGSWTKRWLRRYKQYLGFLRETQEFLASQLDEGGRPYWVQTVVGFAETDLGLGFVTRAERDRTGAYARTLAQLIADGAYTAEARQALNRFLDSFLASRVIVTDLGIKNLVYAYSPEHGDHFVLIDGYGEKNFLPLNSYCPWLHQRHKRKRVARFHLAIARALRRRAESAAPRP